MYNELEGLDIKYPPNATVHQKSEIILNALRQTTVAAKIKREVKDELIKGKYTVGNLGGNLPKLMEDLGCSVKLKNCIRELQDSAERHDTMHGNEIINSPIRARGVDEAVTPPIPKLIEYHQAISEARSKWRSLILSELQSISAELDIPFARLRTTSTEQARQNRETIISTDSSPPAVSRSENTDPDTTHSKPHIRGRPPINARSMLKVLCDIRSANHIRCVCLFVLLPLLIMFSVLNPCRLSNSYFYSQQLSMVSSIIKSYLCQYDCVSLCLI